MEKMKEIKDYQYSAAVRQSQDLSFYAAGVDHPLPGESYGPIVRSYHVIHFVVSGKGKLYIHQNEYPVQAGEAFLLPAGVPHYYKADDKEPWSYAWISFLGLYSSIYMSSFMAGCSRHFITPSLDANLYFERIEDLVDRSRLDGVSHFRCAAVLNWVLADLPDLLNIEDAQKDAHNAMDEVKYFIDMNIGKNLKVTDIAETFGFHPNYLIRRFSEEFSVSPKQYMLENKLLKARLLIEKSSEPISYIAASLGFDDPAAFSRTFKKRFGITPTRCRDEASNQTI